MTTHNSPPPATGWLRTFYVYGLLGAFLGMWVVGQACTSAPTQEPSQEAIESPGQESAQESTSERPAEPTQDGGQAESSEPSTPEQGAQETSTEGACPDSCRASAVRCAGDNDLERCTWKDNCLAWVRSPCGPGKACKDSACTVRSCDGPGQCGEGFHCKEGRCEDNKSCCTLEQTECTQNAQRTCEQGEDGCGKWSSATPCPADSSCAENKCTPCRHRPCSDLVPCCQGFSCLYGYCLTQCDSSQGESNNPACASGEFCIPPQANAQDVCLPDGTEDKGATCSIVKPCKAGLSCADIGEGLKCYTDCNPSQGSAGNPRCDTQEVCGAASGAPNGGICAPTNIPPAKLYETCSTNRACLAPNLCIGIPGVSANNHCLAPCDPTAPFSSCSAQFLCTGYSASDRTKGICLQRCSNPGTKDNCLYGKCTLQSGETICL